MIKKPVRPKLIDKILKEVKKYPEGIWIRKLARNLKEPLTTIHKYIVREDYAGKYVKIEKLPQERGGHVMIKLRRRK